MSQVYPVTIPKWGIEMQEGTVAEWRIAQGDPVEKGEELIDIESDKIVNTMEAPVSGVLRRILARAEETLKVGQLLGVIAAADVSEEAVEAFIAEFVPADASFGIDGDDETPERASPAAAEPVSGHAETSTEPARKANAPAAEVRVSPVAKRLAAKLGVDVSQITGTGRNGRISTADVEAAAAGGTTRDVAPDDAQRISFSSRELAAARRLVASKQGIPHFYLKRDLDMRAALGAKGRDGVPLTALLLKALANALQDHPRLRSHLQDDALLVQPGVAINVAVDTPEGLVAPALTGIETLTAEDIASRLASLAERAREKALGAQDLAPGGFTLSNLGMFGISEFTAIINPPQVAILAVGSVRPLPLGDGGSLVPGMSATLSCDHRAVDGAAGARFLATLQDALDSL